MTHSTELWSFDPGKGRSIKVTLDVSKRDPQHLELDMRWDDGEPVKFPIKLTDVDLQNLAHLISEVATERGIDISR